MELVKGGYSIRSEDRRLLNNQRAITKKVNDNFIQVGAVFLKMSGKIPISDDWAKSNFHDTNLQDWIDNEELQDRNVGFNLQQGWLDIDIDAADPSLNACILAALAHCNVDTRFRFGRRSVGFPTHILVQLGEEESANFDTLKKFEPKAFMVNGKRCHVELRSMETDATPKKNANYVAKQTVMPGSIYSHKTVANEYDISVWYDKDGKPAESMNQVAATTPRKTNFKDLIRSIAFGVFLYSMLPHWVEGQRQTTAAKISGWLARVVRDSRAMNNHEVVSADVWCPVDDDSVVESMLHFVCKYMGDEEPYMRVRAYHDAMGKLERNPDAKIPGWPVIENMLGGELVNALRTVFTPGSDVSVLTKLADRYVYDENTNEYIDRQRHVKGGKYSHESNELMTRHKHEVIRINGKPKEAFKVFESSDMRRRVDIKNLYPDLAAGGIFRIAPTGDILSDDDGEEAATVVFNSWRGWPVQPTQNYNEALMKDLIERLDRLLGYLTSDNERQIDWVKKWLAWTFQHPGVKQQIAWVCIGGQGVGKSFFGTTFMKALMGRLWGQASSKVMEGGFSIEPFIDNMLVFLDEAKFNGDGATEEIKKIVRNVDIGGVEKFKSSDNYRIFSRVMFASNRFDLNIGQANVIDRAMFYTKAYDKENLNMTEMEFRVWAEKLKPWFAEMKELLDRRDVREHYIKYLMEYPTTLIEVESIKYSSSNDPIVVVGNMSWPRRIAKYMLEEARILEDMDICYPFTMSNFNERVAEVTRLLGFKTVQGQRVLHEFQDAGLIHRHVEGAKAYLRFTKKWGDTIDTFGAATGAPMEPQFEITENDRGMNDCTTDNRIVWRGSKAYKF